MNPSAARPLIAGLAGRRVLVVGDVMLDDFLFGDVERISPEAPVPVVRFQREEFRLGGAANVAHNVHALGAQPILLGVVGQDEGARRLTDELSRIGISAHGLVQDPDRCTTRKLRVVTRRNQQVSRIDYETDGPLNGEVERGLVERLDRELPHAAVVVISDYLKGAVSKVIASHAIEKAADSGIPVVVDPKVPHVDF
jgi:rfaE bifunctional protein kinase chain/domain